MENLSLIDIASEDDLLISSSSDRLPDLRSPENHDENNIQSESFNAHEGENPLKMSKQWGQAPELSESPERKRSKFGKVNLRKSLAWDSAFFTNEGVLDTEELAIVNSTFRKTETRLLPGIQEELCRSTESISTLDSESYTLENIDADLFENIRASIQKTVCKSDNTVCGKPDASKLVSRKKVEISSQTKMKPPLASKRDGVNKRLECTSKETVVNAKEVAKSCGNSKLLLKQPRTVAKPTLPVIPSIKDSSGSIQKKIDIRRTSSGNVANRHGAIAFSKTNGDSRSLPSRSLKPKPSSRLGTVVFSASPHSSTSSSNSGSSKSSGKLQTEPIRKRSVLRNSDCFLPGSTNKTPVSASKSIKVGPSNSSPSTRPSPTFKFSSSRVSPSSSVDSLVSEASSSTSTSIKPRNSVESFASSTSSCLSFAVAPDIDAYRPTDSRIFSADQPGSKRRISRNPLPSQQHNTVKASLSARVSDLSSRDQSKSSINSCSGAKSFTPSGLRMPSPKIGYFDAEKTLVSNSSKLPQMGVRNNLLKSTAGISSTLGANKGKPSNIPSIKVAVSVKTDSSENKLVPLSPTMRTISAHHQSKPAHLHKDLSPVTNEGNHSMFSKGTIKMAEEVQLQSLTTAVPENGRKSENGTPNDSSENKLVPLSPTMRTVSAHHQSKPAHLHKDLSPVTNEGNHSMIFKGTIEVAEEVQLQSLTTSVPENGRKSEKGTPNDCHSVCVKFQKENLLPASETNGIIQLSPSKVSIVDIMDKMMSSLSLSEASEFVSGD